MRILFMESSTSAAQVVYFDVPARRVRIKQHIASALRRCWGVFRAPLLCCDKQANHDASSCAFRSAVTLALRVLRAVWTAGVSLGGWKISCISVPASLVPPCAGVAAFLSDLDLSFPQPPLPLFPRPPRPPPPPRPAVPLPLPLPRPRPRPGLAAPDAVTATVGPVMSTEWGTPTTPPAPGAGAASGSSSPTSIGWDLPYHRSPRPCLTNATEVSTQSTLPSVKARSCMGDLRGTRPVERCTGAAEVEKA